MCSELSEIFKRSIELTERNLSQYACKDSKAWRLKQENKNELRSAFAIDRDRILYSGAYRRYQGKTQVFSFTNMFDEEMTNRSLHTTYVSQIARTIGKVLRLNSELIEAIALGHDLGHTPFGHEGERALNKCCLNYGIGKFEHNIASLYIVDYITNRGQGLNLTFQVRDGIISHNGEIHNRVLSPHWGKSDHDIKYYIDRSLINTNTDPETDNDAMSDYQWMPNTLEGCVVRVSDTIAYIGKDIEDAIRFNILKREDLPSECVNYFGNTNREIVNKLIRDVILNSYGKSFISMSEEASMNLIKLKKFNYERIYKNPVIKTYTGIVYRSMVILFDKYIDDINKNNAGSNIFKHFLNHKSIKYLEAFTPAEKVRDFIATMTDRYFNEEIKDYLIPGKY